MDLDAVMDPVRRQFGSFGRFRGKWATAGWRFTMLLAAAGGAIAGMQGPHPVAVVYGGMSLIVLGGLLGAVLGTLALPAERDEGTWDPLILTTYPRDALARALLFGTLARTLTLIAVPTLAWAVCAATVVGAENVPVIPGVTLLVPIGTHLGVCLGGDASVKARTLPAAVVRAGLGTMFFLFLLVQLANGAAMLIALVVPEPLAILLVALLAWPAWIGLYRRIFFGMLAEYFEPEFD